MEIHGNFIEVALLFLVFLGEFERSNSPRKTRNSNATSTFLIRSAGGGIRHVIAHGATCGGCVPREFCDRVLAVALSLCITFLPRDQIFTGLLSNVHNYITREFGSASHPKSLLQKEYLQLYHDIETLQQSTREY